MKYVVIAIAYLGIIGVFDIKKSERKTLRFVSRWLFSDFYIFIPKDFATYNNFIFKGTFTTLWTV